MSATFSALHDLESKLHELDRRAQRRRRRIQQKPCGPEARIDGRVMLSFASNDYLGLANAPELIEAAREALPHWGLGSGASHLVSGHTEAHEAMEQQLARFTGMPAAISFSTGYLANIAVMPALLGREDEIFADRLNHASLIDGALLSRARLTRYAHCDLAMLGRQLEASRARRKLIVTDSVFSMDGDLAPLPALLELAERYDAWLLIDDAHGFGVLGPQGRGALAAAGLSSPRLILMATLGKAAGVGGAFVAAHPVVVEWLMQTARPCIFTTATPPLLAAAVCRALELIEAGDARRARLQQLIARLRQGLEALGYRTAASATPIQPVIIGENAQALSLSRALEERGLYVPAIRPPTVPQGSARLRVSLTAAHSEADVDRLLEAMREARTDMPSA
ncbi:8-amino-7-oxononanoate synthase [Uliginosibacterium paludis]|uniref:8-amino-7-oxononanoate synthase n=1 Tax=Uliginosibacterium paludis TaxID=1615952 RepID=A0ABV2CLN8_9RHOO